MVHLVGIFIRKTSHTGVPYLAVYFEYIHCFIEVLNWHMRKTVDTRPLFLLGRKNVPREYKSLGTRLYACRSGSKYWFIINKYYKKQLFKKNVLG